MLDELRERKLVQWALAYVAGAWVVLELAGFLAEQFGWAPAMVKVLTVVLGVGLVVVLVVAWYHGELGRQRVSGPELLMVGALLVVAGAAVSWVTRTSDEAPATVGAAPAGDVDARSIAVLPLDNLSNDADLGFFTDGIHDELISQLAKIGALTVISRTSVMQYRDASKNLREIAGELGVRNVLEGSVRRAGNRVRITTQLLDASRDELLWTDTFDRELEDVFAIQEDIATEVAAALHAELNPRETARLGARPTDDLEAYDFYLKGNSRFNWGYAERDIRYAIQMYEEAVRLDPEFAVAYARLSRSHGDMYWFSHDRTQERIEASRAALERAEALAPDNDEVLVAGGFFHYHLRLDYEEALSHFERASALQPNSPLVLTGTGYVQRRMGLMRLAVENIERATVVDPNSGRFAFNLAESFMLLRDYERAAERMERAISLLPQWPRPYAYGALLHILRGDAPAAALAVLEDAARAGALPVDDALLPFSWFLAGLVEEDYAGGLRNLDLQGAGTLDTQFFLLPQGLLRGQLHTLLGEPERAAAAYRVALEELQIELSRRPDDERVHGALGLVYAGLGRYDDAVRAARRGVDLLPVTREAYRGTFRLEDLARVYSAAGEVDLAVEVWEDLLERPALVSAEYLRIDPRLEELRQTEAFQSLLDRYTTTGS